MAVIIGFDPGVAIVGYGIIDAQSRDDQKVLAVGAITTPSGMPHYQRLATIYDEVIALIEKYSPQLAGVENLYFGRNTTTAMKVSEARGVLLLALEKYGLDIQEFTPLQIKESVTGYGRADKVQVQRMVTQLLKLKEIPKPDDAADALGVALTVAVSTNLNNL